MTALESHYARAQEALRAAREHIAATVPDPEPDVFCPCCGAQMSVMRGRHTQTWWLWHPPGAGVDPCPHGNRNFSKQPTRTAAVAAFEGETK